MTHVSVHPRTGTFSITSLEGEAADPKVLYLEKMFFPYDWPPNVMGVTIITKRKDA